jgi:protein SCO1
MKSQRAIWLFFGAVFLLPLSIYAVVNWYEQNNGALPVYGTSADGKLHRLSDFTLANQDAQAVGLRDWKGKIIVANFFFTHCPVICPKMMNNLKEVARSCENDREVQINSFTVDPERDSIRQLHAYAERMRLPLQKWNLLTGSKPLLYRLARKNFFVVATDGDGGKDDFIHSDRLVLVDQAGQIRGYYSGTEPAEVNQLIKDIKKLKHAR